LLERRDSLIAVDDQISIRLLGLNHDDRRLLTADRQRCQQPPLSLRPAYAKVLQTMLKLVEFQPHHTYPPRQLHSAPDLIWDCAAAWGSVAGSSLESIR
jgi:hypothetical protein